MQRLQERVVERRADAADRARRLVGGTDLPDDLVLADDERLEATGHAHQVSERPLVVEFADHVGADVRDVRVERGAAGRGVGRDDVRLRAVARLEDERLVDARLGEQGLDGVRL